MVKQKRMVNGIPVFLFYKTGNMEYIPDDSITGATVSIAITTDTMNLAGPGTTGTRTLWTRGGAKSHDF